MNFDVQRRGGSFSPYSPDDISRFHQINIYILDEYHNALDDSAYIDNKSIIRLCEQELIKLDKKELEEYLQHFVKKQSSLFFRLKYFDKQNGKAYASCVLHLIHVFCIPGQEEKKKVVQVKLNEVLHTKREEERYDIFQRYLSQHLKVMFYLTDKDLFGQIDPLHEFRLKLCYWDIVCAKKGTGGCTEFLKKHSDFLLSNIEGVATNVQWQLSMHKNTQPNSCNILLCLLNWNICKTQTPVTFQNMETPSKASSSWAASVADTLINYTTNKVRSILQTVLSTLSEDEIFTAFNEYLDRILTMKSKITEDDFCTGKIEPYHEFILKLCYCEKLCNEHDDDETYRKFLRRNADFLVLQIEEVVDGNNTKTKLLSCKVLLCLVKWDVCNQKIAYTTLNKILSQMLTQKDECQDFLNENALFFVSMVRTVIKRNNIALLINLCEVLLCIPCNEHHHYDVIGAANKLIRYYAKQVGINKKTLQWVLLLGHSFLKHLSDNQKIDTASKRKIDYQKFCHLLKELFTDSKHERKALDLLIEAFKDNRNLCHENQNKYCNYLREFTKEQDAIKQEDSCKDWMHGPLSLRMSNEPDCISTAYSGTTLSLESCFTGFDLFNQIFEIIFGYVIFFMVMVCMTSAVHLSSAKLEKYLSLKHHYPMASLYLLWCSGDIEVHPGPCSRKKTLVHDSSKTRIWIKNVCKMLDTTLSDGVQSKYREKQGRISDKEYRELFKDLLKVCYEEKVLVPQQYLAEINAWETMEYKLLHKLFINRCEIETIIASLQDFLTCGGSTNDLTDINVSIITELKTNEIAMFLGQDQRPKDISQMVAHITRHIAGISIKCAHGKDPDTKYDGLWNLHLKDWPKDIVLFDPNNRGKYRKKSKGRELISDQELVDILLTLTEDTIPRKYKDIVDDFKIMRKSIKEKSIHEQQKAELCSTFKRITSLEKLDSALKNIWKSGIFTEEVHYNLNKWCTIEAVETTDDKSFSQVDIENAGEKERPHIAINISTKSITLTVQPTSPNSTQVSYDIPLKDELVPLKTMATTVLQTTIQKPSSDSYKQKVTAKIYSTVSPQPNACPADIQTNSIFIPPNAMTVLNSYFPLEINPNSQAILESDIKHQHKISSQETALFSTIKSHQPTSSTNQFCQLNQDIAISGKPVLILCTPYLPKTNSDDTTSATKDSQSLDYHTQVSPTSDMGSSDSISLVNSDSGNDDQNNISNGSQVILTDSDYSSDSSNNCASKTNMKKRKLTEEDSNEMKKRKITSLKQDKKPIETNHRQMDCLMDNTASFNKNREILPDWLLDIDLDSYDIDDQTFKVDLNALDNEDNELVKFLQDMINCESEKNVTNEVI